jgi:lysophospholipase L1-like esterase
MNTGSAPSSQPILSPQARTLGYFLLAVAPALIAAFLILISPPIVIVTGEGQSKIFFSAERRSVFLAGECLTARWEVEGIKEVYINDQPTTGSDSRAICVTPDADTMPTLKVIFQDGAVREYRLDISIVSRNPLLWVLVGLAGLFLLTAVYTVVAPTLAPYFRPVWPLARKAITVVEITFVTLLIIGFVLEFCLRLYFSTFGTERERIMYLYSAADIAAKPSNLIPMPYVSYVPSPVFEGHNALGYRGAEIQLAKPQGTFRIVALGGSTTYSTSTRAEDSYPAQLQQLLRDQYGYSNAEVVNAGVAGYTSWDTFVNYALRVIELQPDLLMIYDGINDIEPRAAQSDCYQGDNPLRGLNPFRSLWQPSRIDSASTLHRFIGIHLGWMPDPSTVTGAFNYFPMACSFDNANIKNNPPLYFERNLRSIIALAQANGTQIMLSTWTYNPDGDQSAVPPEWRVAVVEHNAILRRLAGDYDLPFYDLAATDFAADMAHWAGSDPVHMSAAGTHEQARQYAAFIAQNKLIP